MCITSAFLKVSSFMINSATSCYLGKGPEKSSCVWATPLTREQQLEGSQKLKNGTNKWCSNSSFGYLFKENKYTNSKIYMHCHVYCSIIYGSKDMKQPKWLSIDKWIKMWLHPHNGIVFIHKRMKSCNS